MKYNYVPIDFEFHSSENEHPVLVCASLIVDGKVESYWLHGHVDLLKRTGDSFGNRIRSLHAKGCIFLTYMAIAEARCLITLGIDPADLRVIDLYVEYRMLANHNHKVEYGKHLIGGQVVTTHGRVSYDQTKKVNNSRPEFGLSSACFKFLGERIDEERKEAMRDIIISKNYENIEASREEIVQYCESDVEHLLPLYKAMASQYLALLPQNLHEKALEFMLARGKYSCLTAWIEHRGYPINYEETKAFSENVPNMLRALQRDINAQFPDIRPFKFVPKTGDFTWDQTATREWIKSLPHAILSRWDKTDTGAYSLSLDAFQEHFDYKHTYPRGNLGAQFVRYLKFKQSLNGFMPVKEGAKRRTFWESVGSDHRVRPFLGIYGSQSGRNQPSATGFIFLKAAWMRALVQPPQGKVIIGIDFSSQEFLIAALLSEDENMLKAYESGDVYLYFAKLAGAVPWDGSKADYKAERDLFKATTLGIQYGMGEKGLALKLSADMGKPITEAQAYALIKKFERSFPQYVKWKDKTLQHYKSKKSLILPDGWPLWGDNINHRSVLNFPVQGMGASILRRSVEKCHHMGLKVVVTLHDALYVEVESSRHHINWACTALDTCMSDAFQEMFEERIRHRSNVRLDGKMWGPIIEDGEVEIGGVKFHISQIHVDERAKEDYEQFKKYFKKVDTSVYL